MTSITARPILFSGPMIRAILNGEKTQTRRIASLAQCVNKKGCPYGDPGDLLWVRETWQAIHVSFDPETGLYDDFYTPKTIPKDNPSNWWAVRYAATDPEANDNKEDRGFSWRPSIFMPRWASRITLEIAAVRIERLQDISEDDARAEGITDGGCLNCGNSEPCGCASPEPSARDGFCCLWHQINGLNSWHANPWVWVVEFRVLSVAGVQS
jgi:hypothetical protein